MVLAKTVATEEETREEQPTTLQIETVVEDVTIGTETRFKRYGLLVMAQEFLWQRGLDQILDEACLVTKKAFKHGTVEIPSNLLTDSVTSGTRIQMCVAYTIMPQSECKGTRLIQFITSHTENNEPRLIGGEQPMKLSQNETEQCVGYFANLCSQTIASFACRLTAPAQP